MGTSRPRRRPRAMASELVNVVFQFLHHVPMPEAMREALTHAKAAVDQRDFWLSILVFAVVLRLLRRTRVPKIVVKLTDEEENGIDGEFWDANAPFPSDSVPCYDPGNMRVLGPNMRAMTADEVRERIARAAKAQKQWAKSSFETRRTLLRVIQRFILEEQDTICRVSARDSGKPLVDAAFGEVLVTLEKIRWLCNEGEQWLKPEHRSSGAMMFYKKARVEYHPVGVMGAIVPWNYPFHNVFNPLVANLFAGNALVVKVSEYASWSSQYYGRVIDAALDAVGAPRDLVQIITGYGEAGSALVTGGVQKVVFVGSTGIGRKVMEAAAKTLTPVVLELGGKDPFIVCADADLNQCVPMALRGAFQSCGQNCAGAERFYVHEKIHDKFLAKVLESARKLRQGWALSSSVDCGAMCMPKQAQYVQSLIDDAVARGATVHVGGKIELGAQGGQFYPPTVISGITHDMRIAREEVFGPVLAIVKTKSDEESISLANDCDFGLGSNVFTRSTRRAEKLGSQLEAGMTSINDFCSTYMAQSLPFGGVKESGFDRFAGIEGLRGCCVPKSVVVDRFPWLMKTNIPPPLCYPVADNAFAFCKALSRMFFGLNVAQQFGGLLSLAKCFLMPSNSYTKYD